MTDPSLSPDLTSWQELVKAQTDLIHDALAAMNAALLPLSQQADHDVAIKEKDHHIQYLTSDLKEKTKCNSTLQREVDHQRWLLINMIPDYKYTEE